MTMASVWRVFIIMRGCGRTFQSRFYERNIQESTVIIKMSWREVTENFAKDTVGRRRHQKQIKTCFCICTSLVLLATRYLWSTGRFEYEHTALRFGNYSG
jgi:hypothetical protein